MRILRSGDREASVLMLLTRIKIDCKIQELIDSQALLTKATNNDTREDLCPSLIMLSNHVYYPIFVLKPPMQSTLY